MAALSAVTSAATSVAFGRAGGMTGAIGAIGAIAAVVIMTSSCGSTDDPNAVSAPSTTVVLAPSQQNASTVPTPTLSAACDPDRVGVVVVEPGDGVGQPDQVIDLVNEGDAVCDVDISASGSAAADMEPSVRLAPGEVGHVWVVGRDDCDETLSDPSVAVTLDVNGADRRVDLIFESPCGVELAAFFTD